MKQCVRVFCLLLVLVAGNATAAQEHDTAKGHPVMPPMSPGMEMPSAPHQDPEFDAVAARKYRPEWGPLPFFRGDKTQLPALRKLFASQYPKTRARSAFLMGQTGTPESRELLAKGLKDKDRDVRMHSGIALASLGDARGIEQCSIALQSARPWAKYYAIYGLWNVNTTKSKAVLRSSPEKHGAVVNSILKKALSTPHKPVPTTDTPPKSVLIPRNLPPLQFWERAADGYSREADWWFHNGDYNQAIRCLETSILFDPTYTESYGLIAWLQWSMERDGEAIATLKRAIQAVPNDPDAYFELGRHYNNTKRYKEANPYLAKAVQLGADQLHRRVYAHNLEELGRLDEALRQWKALVDKNPKDGAAIRNYERVRKLVQAKKG